MHAHMQEVQLLKDVADLRGAEVCCVCVCVRERESVCVAAGRAKLMASRRVPNDDVRRCVYIYRCMCVHIHDHVRRYV